MWLHYFIMIYIVVLGLFLGTGRSYKYKKVIYLFLTFGLFTILSSLRSENIGNDTTAYVDIFKRIIMTGDISPFIGRYEIGYLLLNKVGGVITENPQIILVITSVITMIGFSCFFYRYSKLPWLSVFLFYTLGYYGGVLNTIRHSVALVLILLAFHYIIEKKLFKFILAVLVAFLFHRTAILFIIAWPITKIRYNYKTVAIAVITTIGLYISFPYILQLAIRVFPTYSYYAGSAYLDGEVRLASLFNFFVGLCVILYGVLLKYHKTDKIIVHSNKNNMDKKLSEGNVYSILISLGVCITVVSFNFNLLDRVGYFFMMFTCVYIPNTVHQIKDKHLRVLNIMIIVMLFAVYYTTILIFRPEWNQIYPYEFFWNI